MCNHIGLRAYIKKIVKLKEILLEKIVEQYPEIQAKSCLVVPSRHSRIIEVETPDKTLIFKFPNNSNYNFNKEVNVLNFLKGKLRTPIPKVLYEGSKYAFFGYEKIEGHVPSWGEFAGYTEDRQKKILGQLASFLVNVHHAINVGDALKLSVNDDPSQWYIDGIREGADKLDNELQTMASGLISTQPKLEMKQFIYNDLHPNNFILDESFDVAGVIDFGFVSTGDVHREFQQMYKICPSITQDFVMMYASQTGTTISMDSIAWLAKVDSLNYYMKLKQSKNIRPESLERVRKELLEIV